MKEMVNAFRDYARAPDMDINRFDLGRLVAEIVDLYRSQDSSLMALFLVHQGCLSSPKMTSAVQWQAFSTAQCSRMAWTI